MAQKPGKMQQKGAPGVEGPGKASADSAAAAGAQAPGQAAPMSVTLGG